jgi:REP element-mobilizing transposase RayT
MSVPSPHKGWHSRGYLPHFDIGEIQQAITFRLADALPREVIIRWQQELESTDSEPAQEQLRIRIARYEDAGHGSCLLRDPAHAELVQNTLLHFDDQRYRLLEWCVMPNHVHVLIHCIKGTRIGELVKSWKIHTTRGINQMLGRQGSLWAPDYHDRYIRDLDHFNNAKAYIRNNPVKAGLCASPEDWPWSSGGYRKP